MPSKINILIIDDEIKYLDSITQRLEMRGFEVTKAADKDQVLDAAGRAQYDLAVIDLKFPGMDGKQIMELLKKSHKFIEMIIITGHGSFDSAVECTKKGAFNYLLKPVEIERLLDILKDACVARLKKKYQNDPNQMQKISRVVDANPGTGIWAALCSLDNDEK